MLFDLTKARLIRNVRSSHNNKWVLNHSGHLVLKFFSIETMLQYYTPVETRNIDSQRG
jgi:hypothetical protein